MYRCDKCGDTYKETLYAGGQSEVSEVITDAEGNPLTNAEVTVTEVNTGETFTLTTDENGCLDYVFPEGTWELLIHKDGYTDTYAYVTVADGDAEVDIPAVETNPCDCLCHQTNIFAKIFRIILKICKMFGIDVHCCDDSPLNDI
ncbi:MAG: carboxypeptidase-like regulatory domain-containing protein [Clostridiales bacterium]|nr:carboxypeptidase-like regulatory domain-containing protein [Clostridiales bacterium]